MDQPVVTYDVTVSPCAPVAVVEGNITEAFGEMRYVTLTPENGVDRIVLWINPLTGGWSLVKNMPDGRSCPLSAGTGFEEPGR